MRPSPRLVLMTPPPPLGDLILGRLGRGAQALGGAQRKARFCARQASLALEARAPTVHGSATGPCQVEEPGWERRSNFSLWRAIDGVDPFHVRLAKLARAVAGVHLIE